MWKTIISNFNTSFGIVLMGLLGSIIMARTLGPENRGNIAAANLWPNLLLYMGSFGTYQSVIFFYAKKRDEVIMWGSCIIATLVNSLISISIGLLFIRFFLGEASHEVKWYSNLLLLSLPFSILSQFITSILQAKTKFKQFNIIRTFFPLAYLLSILLLYALNRLTFTSVLTVQIFLNVLICLMCLIFYHTYMGSIFHVKFNLRTLKVLYNYGVKVWAGDLSQGLNYRLDQILISNFFSTTQLGFYVVAQSIANFTTILANSFKTILLPIVAKTPAFKEKIRTINQTLRKFNLVNTIMLVVSIVLVPFLLVWVFGKAFKQSELLAILLLCGFYFLNIKTVMTAAVQGLGRPFYVSISDFAGLFILLILVYPLSKWYGINGAAIAVGISYMAQFISIYILYKKIALKV